MTRVALLVAALATSALTQAHAADANDAKAFNGFSSLSSASSAWKNQSGSTMTINIDPSGMVTGQYINRAQGTGCQNSPYPLVGRVTGNFIAFSVAWNNAAENCNSATGWAGYAQAAGGSIELVTNWNLSYQGQSGPAIEQGKDRFEYVPTIKTSSFVKK